MVIHLRAMQWLRVAAAAALAASGIISVTHAQAARTAQDGVYTDAQAARGQAVYDKQCASCHGQGLKGLQAPPLVGDGFAATWQGQPLLELANKIRNTMPADEPGSVTAAGAADLVALILKSGGFPASRTELASTEAALKAVGWPARPAAAQAAGSVKAYPPLGNMAQLMRGVFFPNSNLIFTVQTRDPAAPAPKPTPEQQAQGFSVFDWGQGIYAGWQMIDNAAIAIADASPLMLAPGIRCENGRLAPVTDPEWIKYTEDMIAVARKTYKASQSRSQDAVSEATGDLSDACAACHQAYREVRGRGRALDPTDPSNKANRCLSRSTAAR
jgi:mono/diheme cytochrome c family protein